MRGEGHAVGNDDLGRGRGSLLPPDLHRRQNYREIHARARPGDFWTRSFGFRGGGMGMYWYNQEGTRPKLESSPEEVLKSNRRNFALPYRLKERTS